MQWGQHEWDLLWRLPGAVPSYCALGRSLGGLELLFAHNGGLNHIPETPNSIRFE